MVIIDNVPLQNLWNIQSFISAAPYTYLLYAVLFGTIPILKNPLFIHLKHIHISLYIWSTAVDGAET